MSALRTLNSALTLLGLCCSCVCAQGADEAVVELPFTSFFRMPIGSRGLEPSEAMRNAEGRRVRLLGYVVAREQATPGRFLITPRPVRLSEHADGEADDLPPATVTVLLDTSQSDRIIAFQPGPVAVTGRLQLGRSEDAFGRVSWFRLQLDPSATASEHSRPAAAAAHHSP